MQNEDLDPEIIAMSSISKALKDLDPAIVERVLRWSIEKYKVQINSKINIPLPSMNHLKSNNPIITDGNLESTVAEIEDILDYNEENGFEFHFRLDMLKANNKIDAVN